ncbi:MAG: putative holin-like toxin [Sporolactobacillus sp.]|nr:putative holin-like toxin [Sporolactobacillus sp.]
MTAYEALTLAIAFAGLILLVIEVAVRIMEMLSKTDHKK